MLPVNCFFFLCLWTFLRLSDFLSFCKPLFWCMCDHCLNLTKKLGVLCNSQIFLFCRSNNFRTAFGLLGSLQSFFQCPTIALSATLTKAIWSSLPKQLALKTVTCVSENPDKCNIKFQRRRKPPNIDMIECSESVYMPQLQDLQKLGQHFPVTLCYLPLAYMADAMKVAVDMFGKVPVAELKCANYFSSQHETIIRHITEELQKESPTLRLVFCSPAMGMGFNSPSISRVIHFRPPNRAIDFVQQVGRAGRKGQQATSILYCNKSDTAQKGVDETMKQYCTTDECLRLCLLQAFDFDTPVKELPGCQCCTNCELSCKCDACA